MAASHVNSHKRKGMLCKLLTSKKEPYVKAKLN